MKNVVIYGIVEHLKDVLNVELKMIRTFKVGKARIIAQTTYYVYKDEEALEGDWHYSAHSRKKDAMRAAKLYKKRKK